MRGGEYLDEELLQRLWIQLDQHARHAIAKQEDGLQGWLKSVGSLWHQIGRVTFHLAENKVNPSLPFAFMASYASSLSNQSRVQHLPLGRAVQEFSTAQNHAGLLKLLEPVQLAASKSDWLRSLVASNQIFKPQPWSASQAYRFLQDIPQLEQSGILVRLPDWWKGRRPSRPTVKLRVGQEPVVGLGAAALLDFSIDATLDGQPLSPEELQRLLSATEGLVQLRGAWIECDGARLGEALSHWKQIEKNVAGGGLSFFEGMRLLAGIKPTTGDAGQGPDGSPPAELAWVGIEAGAWLGSVLSRLREPGQLREALSPPGLRASLRPYQQTGVHWLHFLSQLRLGGCLADDMGLGKTIQVISLLLLRKQGAGEASRRKPSLLVLPASLLGNWKAELARFAPSLDALYLHSSETPALGTVRDLDNLLGGKDLVLTTYGIVTRWQPLREVDWDLVILDEAQAIKNADAQQTRAVKALRSATRFALTGTPVENRAMDLWSLFDFINPGLLGTAASFVSHLRSGEAAGHPDYSKLRQLTRPYILRRLKSDKRVIADLPDKTEMTAWCSLSPVQAALYSKAVAELAEGLKTVEGMGRRGLVLASLMRLKQICNHPAHWLKTDSYAPAESGKFLRLRELVEEIAERQEKVLVFTQFREITGALADFLASLFGRQGLVLHGGTPVASRRGLVEAFQKDEGPPFFVLTVKAGGSGLNLTQASHVLHFDRWWNPAVENQATDRAFRIGQKNNVLVHKFVCRGTIEERIDKLLAEKRQLSVELLEGGAERLLTEMGDDELLHFVSLDLTRASAT